jgi:hypothetical protein
MVRLAQPKLLRHECRQLMGRNPGFIPHDGYATITQFIDATMSVVGMGPQLAIFLSVLGAALDGSGLAWCT